MISSWYPTKDYPLGGIFIKEQVEILAELASEDFNFIVNDWGFYDSEVTFKEPLDAFKKIGRFVRSKKNSWRINNGVYYISNPYLNISSKIPYLGSFDRLVQVSLTNIDFIKKQLGPIDLIHSHVSYPGGYLTYRLSQHLEIPYAITEHMGPFPFDKYMKNGKPIEEIDLAVKNASAILPVSDSLAERMSSFGYRQHTVIPNMVDENLYKPDKQAKKSEKFLFFTLCGLEKPKGVEDLLRAIALWNPSPEKIQFQIAGDGEDREYFHKLASDLNIDSLIHWLDYQPRSEIPKLMNRCDAFVLPSHHESFGIVYVEAIASGKPVIATRCGGPESIVNQWNGKLVPVGDVKALAEAMKSMMNQIDDYNPEKIREDFENRFSRKAVTKKITDQYRSILDEWSSRSK